MPRPTATPMPAMIQNRITMLTSLHPASSKWWCSGDIRNTRLPVVRNETIWMISDIVMMTKSRPRTSSSSSVRVAMAIRPAVTEKRDVRTADGLPVGGREVQSHDAEDRADDQLQDKLAALVEAEAVALANLEEVVDERDRAAEHHEAEQHQPGDGRA